ncbi:MAG: hypothetical protein M0031_00480 [Thermaerobacter sp.]|nr:hypothetical protein [Thermaerobacter sp.]
MDWSDMSAEEIATELGRGLQQLERRLGSLDNQAGVRFPRGVIRTVAHLEGRMDFLPATVTRRNLAYCFQVTDVNRWVMNRFDLGLSAGSLFRKHAAITVVSLMEAVLVEAVRSRGTKAAKGKLTFHAAINAAGQGGLISRELALQLHDARKRRNDIHLHRVDERESNRYDLSHYNTAVLVLHRLLAELSSSGRSAVACGDTRSG